MLRRIVMGIVLAGGVAHADLDADKARKDGEAMLAEEVGRTNDKCGTKLAASYDWASEKKSPEHRVAQGAEICAFVMKGVAEICGDSAEGKKAVAKKLKTVKCKFDGKVTSKKSKGKGLATDLAGSPAVPHTWIELDKSTLHFNFDWFSANTDAETAKYLRKQL